MFSPTECHGALARDSTTASWSPIPVEAVVPRRVSAMSSGTRWYLMGDGGSWEKIVVSKRKHVAKGSSNEDGMQLKSDNAESWTAEFSEMNRTSFSRACGWQIEQCPAVACQERSRKTTAALITPKDDCWGSGSFIKLILQSPKLSGEEESPLWETPLNLTASGSHSLRSTLCIGRELAANLQPGEKGQKH